jgi:hypothetical protein
MAKLIFLANGIKKMDKQKKQNIPFDQYSRQGQTAEIINSLRKSDESFTILDVGGYKGATSSLHPRDKVTILDLFDIKEPSYVKGNALSMPFEDQSFDFVVSFDVFEHIQKKDRNSFISEVSRVSKIATIVAAPIKTPETELAEKMLNDMFQCMHGKDHQWLKEHIENGLPAIGQVQESMKQNGLETIVLPSNEIRLWLAMQGAVFLASKFQEMAEQVDRLNTYYDNLGPFDGSADNTHNYRNIVIGARDKKVIAYIVAFAAQRNFSLESKIRVEQEITQAYFRALDLLSVANASLAEKNMGFDHACKVLSTDVHRLENELVLLRASKSYKLARGLSGAMHKIKWVKK